MSSDNESTFVLDRSTDSAQKPQETVWGRFVCLDGDAEHVDFTQNEVWFGRSKELTGGTRIKDKKTSSKHFRVFLENDEVFIEDQSMNGTFLMGKRLNKGEKHPLKNGDEVTFFNEKPEDGVPLFVFQDKRRSKSAAGEKTEKAPIKPLEETSAKRKQEDGEGDDPRPNKKPAQEEKDKDKDEGSVFEEHLTCGICQDIMYKCVSIFPCLHSFCCSCLYEWIDRSPTCPGCRKTIKGINKSHQIQNLVDLYLAKHPSKQRPKEEIDSLEPTSNVDKLIKKFKENDPGDEEDEDEDDENQCSECNARSGFKCPPNGPHLDCEACGELFADRSGAPGIIQKCQKCSASYCNLYRTCSVSHGGLQKARDIEFQNPPVDNTGRPPFHGNAFELQVLTDYLKEKKLTLSDCWRTSLEKFECKEFDPQKVVGMAQLTPETPLCPGCANDMCCKTLVEFKQSVKSELPARPDCHYGLSCRTQHHNSQHRAKYNHACPQTKF